MKGERQNVLKSYLFLWSEFAPISQGELAVIIDLILNNMDALSHLGSAL